MFSGPFEYDDEHILALRTMTLLLQSRLFDTIRQELGGTYSITATPDARRCRSRNTACASSGRAIPRAPRRWCSACSRRSRREGDATSRASRWAAIREALLREYQENSQENGYFLNQIARRYADGEAANVAATSACPDQIGALTGEAIQQAREDLSETGELREGHADAGREVELGASARRAGVG